MNGTYASNRKMILLLPFLGNLFSTLDRYIINYGIVPISEDLSLSASSTGLIFSAFFAGYAIMQIPGGYLADKFGARMVLIFSMTAFSIFTGLTGVAFSLASLLAIRFIFGIAEGSFFPAGAKMISTSFPFENRSRAMSIFLAAATISGVIAPLFSSALLVTVGWRMMFSCVGIIGHIIVLLYWFLLKPQFPAEAKQQVATSNTVDQEKPNPISSLLKNKMILSLIIASFSLSFISWGLTSWIPTYLVKERGLNLMSLGLLQMIPATTGFIFFLTAGYILDRIHTKQVKWLGLLGSAGLTAIVFLMFNAQTITGFIIFQSILPLFQTLVSVIIMTLPLKRLPEAVGGSAIGIVNFGGQLSGFVAPLSIGFVVDALDGSFNGAVWLLALAGVLCFISFLTLARK